MLVKLWNLRIINQLTQGEMKMIEFEMYEQDLFGRKQWRVMRTDGQPFLGILQVDFISRELAIEVISSECIRDGIEWTIHENH